MYATASTMQTFMGVCHAPNNRPVAGRIVFSKDSLFQQTDSCLLVVHSPDELIWREAENIAGIIQVGFPVLPPQAQKDLPYPILFLSHLPVDSHGKIALLDPSCGALFVSPDIGVFNRLGHRLSPVRQGDRKPPLLLPNGKPLRLGTILSPDTYFPSAGMERVWIPPPSVFEEDTLYEEYRDLAESSVGLSLTVTVSCPRVPSDKPSLRNQLRALFRSAVFGNFSLLIKGSLTLSDRQACFDEIRQVIGDLKQERREFNSAIPCGLLVDVPLLLHEKDLSGLDFLCLDLDRLWDLVTGYSPRTDKEANRAFAHTLQSCLSERAVPCSSVIANRLSSLSSIVPLWREWEITDCFVPPSLWQDAYNKLSLIPSL